MSDRQHGLQQVGAKHIGSRDVPALIELVVVAVIIAKLVAMLLPILSLSHGANRALSAFPAAWVESRLICTYMFSSFSADCSTAFSSGSS